jgi:hypothetical protein
MSNPVPGSSAMPPRPEPLVRGPQTPARHRRTPGSDAQHRATRDQNVIKNALFRPTHPHKQPQPRKPRQAPDFEVALVPQLPREGCPVLGIAGGHFQTDHREHAPQFAQFLVVVDGFAGVGVQVPVDVVLPLAGVRVGVETAVGRGSRPSVCW